MPKTIEIGVEIFYEGYKNGPIGYTFLNVELEDEEIERLKTAGQHTSQVDDIYEKMIKQVEDVVNEEISLNDGYWYYDFTEYYSAENPFSIREPERTGYSMEIVVDYGELPA